MIATKPVTPTPDASKLAPKPNGGLKRRPDSPAWLYCDALEQADLLRYFLKALRKMPGERHGNLRAALSHARTLVADIEALIDELEDRP